jgi:hypothetical protein
MGALSSSSPTNQQTVLHFSSERFFVSPWWRRGRGYHYQQSESLRVNFWQNNDRRKIAGSGTILVEPTAAIFSMNMDHIHVRSLFVRCGSVIMVNLIALFSMRINFGP